MPDYQKKSKYTLAEIDAYLGRARGVSNPNLLDNWYFGNPVNQRGQTSYTGAGYGIDRWNLITGTLLIRSNGICLYNAFLDEYFDEDLSKYLVGKTITISALTSGGLCFATAVIPENLQTEVNFVSVGFNSGSISAIWSIDGKLTFRNYAASSGAELYAVKMEIGTQQTLAHQENGVWVLNEIPDYGEQLRRCQRYYFKPKVAFAGPSDMIAVSSNTLYGTVAFPTQMRSTPSIKNVKFRRSSDGYVFTPTTWHMGLDGGNDGFNTIFGISVVSLITGEHYTIDYEATADL